MFSIEFGEPFCARYGSPIFSYPSLQQGSCFVQRRDVSLGSCLKISHLKALRNKLILKLKGTSFESLNCAFLSNPSSFVSKSQSLEFIRRKKAQIPRHRRHPRRHPRGRTMVSWDGPWTPPQAAKRLGMGSNGIIRSYVILAD